MGYRWKAGEVLESWRAQQRHKSWLLVEADVVRPRPDACEGCGRVPGLSVTRCSLIHMHHPDYERPELVEWLCGRCHRKAPHRIPPIVTWEDLRRWEAAQAQKARVAAAGQLAFF